MRFAIGFVAGAAATTVAWKVIGDYLMDHGYSVENGKLVKPSDLINKNLKVTEKMVKRAEELSTSMPAPDLPFYKAPVTFAREDYPALWANADGFGNIEDTPFHVPDLRTSRPEIPEHLLERARDARVMAEQEVPAHLQKRMIERAASRKPVPWDEAGHHSD